MALLVGVDAYASQPLAGCVGNTHDTHDLAALALEEQEFAFGEIRLLADDSATGA